MTSWRKKYAIFLHGILIPLHNLPSSLNEKVSWPYRVGLPSSQSQLPHFKREDHNIRLVQLLKGLQRGALRTFESATLCLSFWHNDLRIQLVLLRTDLGYFGREF